MNPGPPSWVLRRMKRILASSLFTFAAAALGAQQPAPAPQLIPLNSVVAVVGDQPITYFELRDAILANIQRGMPAPTTAADSIAVERSTLESMIEEELIVQKAKDLKVEVADADIAPQVDNQIKQIRANFPTEAEFRNALAKASLGTPEEYRKYLMDQYRRNALFEKTVAKLEQDGKIVPINVTDAEVKAEFERDKGQLGKKPASVTFKQIVIAPQPTQKAKDIARAKAESLYNELKAGADFERIAKRETMDLTTKETGGDLGWVRRGLYWPETDRWLFGSTFLAGLQPGNISPVFETPAGFTIVRVDRVQPGEVKAHQIVIKPQIDSADIARTRQLADSVAKLWRSGVPFDSLAKKYHDYAGKEETSILTPFYRDSLPMTYQRGFAGAKVGDIVDFQIAGPSDNPTVPKFVVAQLLSLDEGGEPTLADMKQIVRNELAKRGGMRRYVDQLKKQTYVAVLLGDNTVAQAPKP